LDEHVISAWLSRAKTAWASSSPGRHEDNTLAPADALVVDLSVQSLSELAVVSSSSSSSAAAYRDSIKRMGLQAAMWRKSLLWAKVVQRVGHQFDVIEFWDCGAPAYHALVWRLNARQRELANGPATRVQRPLIAVRTHGLYQAIQGRDEHSSAPWSSSFTGAFTRTVTTTTTTTTTTKAPKTSLKTLFRTETRALQLADAVIANSPGTACAYTLDHGLDPRRVFTISPTLGTLVVTGRTHEARNDRRHSSLPSAPPSPDDNILVYGKLQRVKGPDMAARALVQVMRDLAPSEWRGSVIFAGDDQMCDVDPTIPMSACILAAEVPPIFRPRFRFTGRIKRGALGVFASENSVRLVILPSRYETFCLAAHEVAFFGLPIVLPQLPAYEGYFVDDGESAFMFSAGSPDDLHRVVKRAIAAAGAGAGNNNRPSRKRIRYSDPSREYRRLIGL
jgi:hypothetical protein